MELKEAAYIAAALVVVLVIVVLFTTIIHALRERRWGGGRKSQHPRLAVMDQTHVDAKRRLVLVRRDDVEHLLLIGGPSDVVVEPAIVRGQMASPASRGRRVMDVPEFVSPPPQELDSIDEAAKQDAEAEAKIQTPGKIKEEAILKPLRTQKVPRPGEKEASASRMPAHTRTLSSFPIAEDTQSSTKPKPVSSPDANSESRLQGQADKSKKPVVSSYGVGDPSAAIQEPFSQKDEQDKEEELVSSFMPVRKNRWSREKSPEKKVAVTVTPASAPTAKPKKTHAKPQETQKAKTASGQSEKSTQDKKPENEAQPKQGDKKIQPNASSQEPKAPQEQKESAALETSASQPSKVVSVKVQASEKALKMPDSKTFSVIPETVSKPAPDSKTLPDKTPTSVLITPSLPAESKQKPELEPHDDMLEEEMAKLLGELKQEP